MNTKRNSWSPADIVALTGITMAVFLIAIDLTIVGIAAPTIQRGLHASQGALQWTLNGYTLAFSASLLSVGAIGDRYGRRRIFAIGLASFGLASLLCGVSWNPVALVTARFLQGISGSLVLPMSMSLLSERFMASQRTAAFGVFGTVFGLGLVGGPLVGGALVDAFGWRATFFINLPVVVVAILFVLRTVGESSDPNAKHLDGPGLVTSATALAALFYVLIQGNESGWGSPNVIVALMVFIAFVGLFIWLETRSDHSMVDLTLFSSPTFVGMSLLTFLQGASFWCLPVYLPALFQNMNHYSAFSAGLTLLPLTVPLLLLPPIGATVARRVSARTFFSAGMLVTALGIAGVAHLHAGMSWLSLSAPLLLAGVATGLINNQITNVAIAVVPGNRSGMAAALNSTFRHVGYGAGIAGAGAIASLSNPAVLTAAGLNHALIVDAALSAIAGILVLALVKVGSTRTSRSRVAQHVSSREV